MNVAISLFGTCATKVGGLGRWLGLLHAIRSEGSQVMSIHSANIDLYIAVDHSDLNLRCVSNRLPKASRVLILREGPSIRPDQYKERVLNQYSRVFLSTPKPLLLDSHRAGGNLFTVPYQDGFLKPIVRRQMVSKRQRRSLCMVNENKFSLHAASNYHLRQHALCQLSRAGIEVTVAGKHWLAGKRLYFSQQFKSALFLFSCSTRVRIQNLRGPLSKTALRHLTFVGYIDDLDTFFNQFEFVLIIENDNIRVTEKFFNALASGCIPIYFGPNLDDFGIPRDIYVRLNNPQEIVSTVKRVELLSDLDVSAMQDKGESWILSQQTQDRWSEELSMMRLWSLVKK